jgi:hypothetical protein
VDRGTRRLFALMFVAIVAATAVAAVMLSVTTPPEPDPADETVDAVGVVVAVDGQALDDVQGFTLRVEGGELIDFSLSELENAVDFPPGHLAEHQATAEPVRVWYKSEADENLAIRLEDAEE